LVVLRLLGIWLAIATVLSLTAENFLTTANFANIGRATAVFGVAAIGVTVALIAGSLDVSIGATMSLASIVAAERLSAGASFGVAFACGVGVGLAVGLANGLMVVVLGLDALIVTLGTLSIVGGYAYLRTGGSPTSTPGTAFHEMGTGTWVGVPIAVWMLLALAFLAGLLLRFTVFGQWLHAVGDNARASRLAGIRVEPIRVISLMISGGTAAIAGMLLAANAGQANPGSGESYLLDTLAAVVIGGTAMTGGSGLIAGTLIGIAILGTIDNGLNLWQLSSNWQDVIRGGILILALILDRARVFRTSS
jgi:ribose/xylose/arabinose/galactoside ABC-type transport system permease subunit